MHENRILAFEQELSKQFSIESAKILKKIDPKAIFSVVRIDLSKDLSFADIFISIFPDLTKAKNFLLLERRINEIRSILFKRLASRKFPEIRIHLDDSIEYEDKISKLLYDSDKKLLDI